MVARTPVRPGDLAPDFRLANVMDGAEVSLAAYRDHSAVLLGLFRGLHCPFCRRQIFQLSAVRNTLADMAITTVAVLNTERERAAAYFGRHPVGVVLLADPDAVTHMLFGVPEVVADETFERVTINPTGELSSPMHPMVANHALNAKDGFEMTTVDEKIFAAHGRQLVGHFLIDRGGVVRWTSIEAQAGVGSVATFPGPSELLDAARCLTQK